MGKYTLIVAAQPVAGREVEWHRWYDNVHLDEVLAIAGFVSATRLHGIDGIAAMGPWLAIYGIEATDDAMAHGALARLQSAPLTTSVAMDPGSVTFALFREGVSRP